MTSQMAMMGQPPSRAMGLHQNGVMGQQNGLMGAHGVMAQPSGVMSSPYMAGMPQGMMGQQQSGMMVQQQQAPFHHQVYGAQNAQQMQWNVSQVCVCVCLCVWMCVWILTN